MEKLTFILVLLTVALERLETTDEEELSHLLESLI